MYETHVTVMGRLVADPETRTTTTRSPASRPLSSSQ